MKIAKFRIQNFKGVVDTEVHLADEIPGNIVTLIGLNESGKTTILEAISRFTTEDEEAASFVGTVHQKSSLQELIPKDRKAAFSGRISILATVVLEPEDVKELRKLFSESGLELDEEALPDNFTLNSVYDFEDSAHKLSTALWNIVFHAKTPRAKKYQKYDWTGETRNIWLKSINLLKVRIPRIVYFPTFLFDFPDRIYLEGAGQSTDRTVNEYYKRVFQDILDSQGEGLSIQKHVVDRINRQKEAYPNPAMFLAYLFGLDEKSQIDSVMQKMSNEMSSVIFGAWGEILGRSVSSKRIQVDWHIDVENDNSPYLQVSIIDGQSRYGLSERSLGFRWFFSFLLFTQFRKNRKGGAATIFLFDEPAANLHSKAQIKLLESFSRIAGDATYVVYSTHSHYMVSPVFLEKAYIIRNKAVDYEEADDVDSFSIRKTDIEAIKYRRFVSEHPTKTTYFQPVLDALDVGFSPLERSSNALIVEGKFDYHPLVYLRRRLNPGAGPDVFPASGAGDVGALVSLFRGWGVNFKVLFDDDQAGRDGRKRCIDRYLIPEADAVTLGTASADLSGATFEAMYKEDVREAARKFFGVETIGKRQYSLFFQELVATKAEISFPQTEAAFQPLSEWLDVSFGTPPSAKNGRRRQRQL